MRTDIFHPFEIIGSMLVHKDGAIGDAALEAPKTTIYRWIVLEHGRLSHNAVRRLLMSLGVYDLADHSQAKLQSFVNDYPETDEVFKKLRWEVIPRANFLREGLVDDISDIGQIAFFAFDGNNFCQMNDTQYELLNFVADMITNNGDMARIRAT